MTEKDKQINPVLLKQIWEKLHHTPDLFNYYPPNRTWQKVQVALTDQELEFIADKDAAKAIVERYTTRSKKSRSYNHKYHLSKCAFGTLLKREIAKEKDEENTKKKSKKEKVLC